MNASSRSNSPLVSSTGPPSPESRTRLSLLDGDTFDIESYRGRIVVVNFWATWCAPCLKEMPVFEKVWSTLRQEGILLVAVNLGDTPDKIERFLKHRPVTFPILLDIDSGTFEPWQIQSLPTTYIVGPDGRILPVVGLLIWLVAGPRSAGRALR